MEVDLMRQQGFQLSVQRWRETNNQPKIIQVIEETKAPLIDNKFAKEYHSNTLKQQPVNLNETQTQFCSTGTDSNGITNTRRTYLETMPESGIICLVVSESQERSCNGRRRPDSLMLLVGRNTDTDIQ